MHTHIYNANISSEFKNKICPFYVLFTFYFSTIGCYFNKILQQILGDIDFEDLWIPYFNITTDITESKKVVNTKGIGMLTIRWTKTFVSANYLNPLSILLTQTQRSSHY